jgi:hypothetical protein
MPLDDFLADRLLRHDGHFVEPDCFATFAQIRKLPIGNRLVIESKQKKIIVRNKNRPALLAKRGPV